MFEIFILIFGLVIGSFLNVCIYRIPLKQTIVTDPSHCVACGKRIKWYDLIPVISYIILGGKCRVCKQKISMKYPLVELFNGAVYLWIYSFYGLSVQFYAFGFLASCLIVISFIDFEHQIIPNGIIIFMMIFGIIFPYFNKSLGYSDAVIGFFAASIPLLIIAILSRGGMGGGDIKLMAVAGLFLGWKLILLALILGCIVGSVIGLALILLKKIQRRDKIPFGPFLATGIFIAMLYGNQILQWYIGMYF
ncbi:A24 family peptidase [Petroclostridium sp. X23]|uniref:prepilin peptidase n=1 Tax=Petroclostridium sp. X23 TaxID=3045146 RepID=UPI0024ADE6D7|nr:A24 family peptidase [Petroclostridium sp. X23]WHH59664.1 prepilin peptidase [Petroclostridium sp. X23]